MNIFGKMFLKIFGVRFNGDSATYDRYNWVHRHLNITKDNLTLLDVGCGNGWAVFLAARKGYRALGISWTESDVLKAKRRGDAMGLTSEFEILDVRHLDRLEQGPFDVIINTENIEHILDDVKLIRDISNLLKPGGLLYMTTPYLFHRLKGPSEDGPFVKEVEDGSHMRRGYTKAELVHLLEENGFWIEQVSYCTGFFSRQLVRYGRMLNSRAITFLIFPLKILANRLDRLIASKNPTAYFSICIIAQKARPVR